MKIILLVFVVLSINILGQTYKIDIGGNSNQFPRQIELCKGDLIIATIENAKLGYSSDAINIFNVNKNKVARFSNSYRQTAPNLIIDNDKIITTHWELTSSGYDIAQVLILNSDLKLIKQGSFNFGGDTQIQSIIKLQNNYIMAGEILVDNLIVKLNDSLDIVDGKRYALKSKGIQSFQDVIVKDSSIIGISDIYGKIGLSELDFKFMHKKTIIGLNDNQLTRIPTKIIQFNNNFIVLNDDYNNGYTLLGNSIHLFDYKFNYIKEYKLQINAQNAIIKYIANIDNQLYVVGSFIKDNKRNSFLVIFDNNMTIIKSINISDLDVITNILYDNVVKNYHLIGLEKSVDNGNGDLVYIKSQSLNSICNIVDISKISELIEIGKNYSISQVDVATLNTNRSQYSLVNVSNQNSTTTEICKPITNNLDFQLLKVDYKSPCSIDSVEIEIVPNSSNFDVIWFDGSLLKKRFLTKNGNYKVTLTIPGFKDTTFDVSINSIYKGNPSGNLSFTPDTLLFSNSNIDQLTCQTFTLTNVGIDTVTINELAYLKKLNFSSPNSIFPITLLPKESKDLEVCFYGGKFKRSYTDSIRFDNCNNTNFLTLLADIPDDSLSFATRCMLKFNAAAPSKSIVMSKKQLNEYVRQFSNEYKLSNLLGIELLDINAILPNQLVYLETITTSLRILVVE